MTTLFPLYVFGLVTSSALMIYLTLQLSMVIALFFLPIFAACLSGVLLEMGVHLPMFFRRLAFHGWHGRYHAYDDLQVRIEVIRGQAWAAAEDVFRACRLPSSERPFSGFLRDELTYREKKAYLSLAGIRRLRQATGGQNGGSDDAWRFELWFERYVDQVQKRKNERAASQAGAHGQD